MWQYRIKNKYSNIILTTVEVVHTGFKNIDEKKILDTITEFYIMTNSDEIIAFSESGFPIIASKFNNIPITFL